MMMMERKEILTQIKPCFDIEELVCEHVLAKFGKSAWDLKESVTEEQIAVARQRLLEMEKLYKSKHKNEDTD